MRIMVAVLSAIWLLVISAGVYMWADTQPPYEYDQYRSYVVPSSTQAGRQILVHWEFRKVNRVCPGSIIRYIVDKRTNARISYDPTPAATTIELVDDHLDRTFFLPPAITPGPKWYYAEGEYACNPLQRFYPLRVRTPRLSFEVTE